MRVTKITGVAAGTDDTDAVNVSQLKEVKEIANKGWNLSVNTGENKSNIATRCDSRFKKC